MHVVHISVQQTRSSGSSNQSTAERPERPERPEQPERPEAPAPLNTQEAQLRQQIRTTIQAAQDAARDAQNQAQDAQNQVRIINGVPVHAGRGTIRVGGETIELDGMNNVIPPQVVDISIAFFAMCAFMVVGWPLARAFGRRMERGAPSAAAVPAVMGEQLQRIEQAVEAMSIEIERISESQRFLAKLQSPGNVEHAALPGSERR